MDEDMKKIRKNIYLRPWMVKFLDDERSINGTTFSVHVDECLEEHVRHVVHERLRQQRLDRAAANASIGKYMDSGNDESISMPKIDEDVFPLPDGLRDE